MIVGQVPTTNRIDQTLSSSLSSNLSFQNSTWSGKFNLSHSMAWAPHTLQGLAALIKSFAAQDIGEHASARPWTNHQAHLHSHTAWCKPCGISLFVRSLKQLQRFSIFLLNLSKKISSVGTPSFKCMLQVNTVICFFSLSESLESKPILEQMLQSKSIWSFSCMFEIFKVHIEFWWMVKGSPRGRLMVKGSSLNFSVCGWLSFILKLFNLGCQQIMGMRIPWKLTRKLHGVTKNNAKRKI